MPSSRADAACPLFGVKRLATPVVRGGGRGALHRCTDSNGISLLGKRKMKRSVKDSVRNLGQKVGPVAQWIKLAACGMWGCSLATKINHNPTSTAPRGFDRTPQNATGIHRSAIVLIETENPVSDWCSRCNMTEDFRSGMRCPFWREGEQRLLVVRLQPTRTRGA